MTSHSFKYYALFTGLLGAIRFIGWLWGWVSIAFIMGRSFARQRAGDIYRDHLIASGQVRIVPADLPAPPPAKDKAN